MRACCSTMPSTCPTRSSNATFECGEALADPVGGWNLTGFLPELAGVEFAEIFAWYVDAEWRIDWADARNRLGDLATQADLVRTEAQRRAEPTP